MHPYMLLDLPLFQASEHKLRGLFAYSNPFLQSPSQGLLAYQAKEKSLESLFSAHSKYLKLD